MISPLLHNIIGTLAGAFFHLKILLEKIFVFCYNSSMEIIKLTKNFAKEASHIYAKSWKAAYNGIIPQKYLDDLSLEHWVPFLENSPFQNFLLQDNGVFVATSSLAAARGTKYDGYGEIVSIYVLPEYFRSGYGKFIFNCMTENLRSMGFTKICLWVLEENLNARRFYEKMGFVTNGDKKICKIGSKELTEVCYVNVK